MVITQSTTNTDLGKPLNPWTNKMVETIIKNDTRDALIMLKISGREVYLHIPLYRSK